MKKRLLIIEDEKSVAKQLHWGLAEHYDITIASTTDKAQKLLATQRFPVATLDLGLPPFPDDPSEGLHLLEKASSFCPRTKFIVITGNSEEDIAIQAVGLGAADFCAKPLDLQLLEIILARTFRLAELEQVTHNLQHQSGRNTALCGMIGLSDPMQHLFKVLQLVSKTAYPVLISGESGTGKEMAAKAIHELSDRSYEPLIIVNCGAIPENLLESELFGHEKGAFTSAVSQQIGKFEQANGGTLFLDEIGELPLAMQVKLLRVLQEGTVERVGSGKTIQLDVRVLAATNVDLEEAVTLGTFRQDLFFRLKVVPVHLPPLRERGEGIILLAHHFLREEARVLKRGRVTFSSSAIAALSAQNWPGNVRELQNAIRRGLSLSAGKILTETDLGLGRADNQPEPIAITTLKEARNKAEKKAIGQALALTGQNISQAAKILAISRPTLHDLLKKHDLRLH